MASESETVADIVKEMRGIKGGQHTNGGLSYERWRARCQFADDYADRIEEAHRREVDSLNFKLMTAKSEQKTAANVIIEQTNKVEKLNREVAELRECLKEAVHNECNFCRRLKVAEDALTKLQDRFVSSVHDGTIDPYEALKIAEDALAAIREEGGEK